MEPRAHHVLIGLFTVLAAAVAVVFALWLGGAGKNGGERHYVVVFNEAVRGLSEGSAVQYSGIKVGEVVKLSLDPGDPRTVRARIKVQDNIPVRRDTQARLVLTGVTGASVIGLSGGSPESPLLPVPENGDPVIVATPSPITQLLANSDNLMTNLTELIVSAKTMLSPDNAQRVGQALENLERISAAMASQNDNVTAVLQNLSRASAQADATLRDASTLMRRADGLLQGQGAATLASARQAMAALERAGGNLDRLIADNRDALGSGMSGLQDVGPALRQLRSTLASMQAVMRRLEDNPANYLLGRQKIQEFEP